MLWLAFDTLNIYFNLFYIYMQHVVLHRTALEGKDEELRLLKDR